MTDTFEFTLNNPLTEEQWDMITDVDMERTDSITFHTKHGKEVEFAKVRRGKWVYDPNGMDWNLPAWVCSECYVKNDNIPAYIRNKDLIVKVTDPFRWAGSKFCPNCGARMDAERKEE